MCVDMYVVHHTTNINFVTSSYECTVRVSRKYDYYVCEVLLNLTIYWVLHFGCYLISLQQPVTQ